jgi:hypothetical protein
MGGGLGSCCVGHVYGADGAMRVALDVELQHMVFSTEFVDGWWSWEPLCRSCVWCVVYIQLYLLMMGQDTPETCRG